MFTDSQNIVTPVNVQTSVSQSLDQSQSIVASLSNISAQNSNLSFEQLISNLSALPHIAQDPTTSSEISSEIIRLAETSSQAAAAFQVGATSTQSTQSSTVTNLQRLSLSPNYIVTQLQERCQNQIDNVIAAIETPVSEFEFDSESSSSSPYALSMNGFDLVRTLSRTSITELLIPAGRDKAVFCNRQDNIGFRCSQDVTDSMRTSFRIGDQAFSLPLDVKLPLEQSKILPESATLSNILNVVDKATRKVSEYKFLHGDKDSYSQKVVENFALQNPHRVYMMIRSNTPLAIQNANLSSLGRVSPVITGQQTIGRAPVIQERRPLIGTSFTSYRERNIFVPTYAPSFMRLMKREAITTDTLVVSQAQKTRGRKAQSLKEYLKANLSADQIIKLDEKIDIVSKAIKVMPETSMIRLVEQNSKIRRTFYQNCCEESLENLKNAITIQEQIKTLLMDLRTNQILRTETLTRMLEDTVFIVL